MNAFDRLLQAHRLWRSLLKYLGLFCLCWVLILSCTPSPRTEVPSTANRSDRISMGTTAKLRTLDPADAYDLTAGYLLNNLGDPLYSYKLGTTELIPRLATALPTISDDGLTYTIPLRQNVTFHDGTPFNAAAMEFSLRRFIENGGQPSFLLRDLVESIAATDEYELTLTLKKPFAAFPSLLTFTGFCAISPQAYEIGPGKFQPDTFVGTGPYRLANYGTDSLKLDPFENYWGDKPANQGIDIQRYPNNPANLYNAFVTGAVDVAYETLDPQQIRSLERMKAEKAMQVISQSGNSVTYWVLNTQFPPLDTVEIRQALAAMMDRNLLIQRISEGQAEPLYSLIPSTFAASEPVFEQRYGEGDIPRAKELLAKAGYSQTNPLKLEVWYPTSSPVRTAVATALSAIADRELEGILQLEPKSVEFTTATANLDKGVYPTFLFSWFPDFFDPDNYIHPFLSCAKRSPETGCESGGSQSQGSFYYSDRANQLVDRQRQELDPQRRQAIFREIQAKVAEDVPYIPLFQNKEYAFAQKNIAGVTLEPAQPFPLWQIHSTD
ncbi:ABC transporter substrate-binding protein [Phormidium sp. CCY1219]|uniref:ABC transporter substrate-binding protein n=1 Tax=Phormidium sp. CCY1219 TaxID=2886104 RepID=UPI002D1F1AE6|nr:ABC transporter substrate-binding protein [Phormidium sp. CCY1219]MEB3829333.1 ABC transporter substrate-binding protein [Phormidium sp. CCY1219]